VPKIVDHSERRTAIGLAVMRVVASVGAEQATVRAVARESGWSTGVLAHYFGGKDEMLGFAITEIGDGLRRRISALRENRTLPWVRAVLLELLPLDEHRRIELLAWYGFLSRALNNPALSGALRDSHRALEAVVAQSLQQGVQAGEVSLMGTAPDTAIELLTFADGLALRHLFDPERLNTQEIIRLLDERIAKLGEYDHAQQRRPT
jgi:AcrR family transcriptional regulator